MRILVSNDDGPPSAESPFIVGLVEQLLKKQWEVTVVIPSSQKSWISKAFQIKDKVHASFIYPTTQSVTGPHQPIYQPRKVADGELGQWILLDGTPASCVNIGVNNLAVKPFDLVLSGPNFGRNTSNAFSLSSGTIGAAMEGSLCGIRSIALSYAIIDKPIPQDKVEIAHKIAVNLVEKLYNNWPKNDQVGLFSINIPLVASLTESSTVKWTSLHVGRYGRLFKASHSDETTSALLVTSPQSEPREDKTARAAGPGSVPLLGENSPTKPTTEKNDNDPRLTFTFAPDIKMLIEKGPGIAPETDLYTIHSGQISVTALNTGFDQLKLVDARGIFDFGKL